MNIHVQRTLDESYYLGLDSNEVKRRDYSKILGDKKFRRTSENTLLVSQLWLWRFDNIVITAFPRGQEEYRSSHLFDHTLSVLRDMGFKARASLNSDHLMALILSECIHRLDYPCVADLEELILYSLGQVVSVTLDEVETYIDESQMSSISLKKEKAFIKQITAARSTLTMIRNIVLRQEDVWNNFQQYLGESIWKKETIVKDDLLKVKFITMRPQHDLEKFKQRIQRIQEDAERVEKLITIQLDLKSKHASLRESQNSCILSVAVIGFTIITTIFAPLSFLASLLALPIKQFEAQKQLYNYAMHENSSVQAFTTNYVGRYMGSCSTSSGLHFL